MEEAEFRDWLASYTDGDRCMAAFSNQRQFFRVNTIKTSVEKFQTDIPCRTTTYYNAAFELEDRNYPIGKTWEYFLGYIHPQSLCSMLAALAMDAQPTHTVLDTCAAPGSKFSHLAAIMGNAGILVGNDMKNRLAALYATINRLNVLNCIVNMRDAKNLDWKERFERVLLDAPCSSLGSQEFAIRRWKPEESSILGNIQRKMLFAAYDALRPGGELVYATCTYAKEENEQVVWALLENVPNAKLVDVALDIPHDSGLSEYGTESRKCYRIYPHHLESEGFFIAKIRKQEGGG